MGYTSWQAGKKVSVMVSASLPLQKLSFSSAFTYVPFKCFISHTVINYLHCATVASYSSCVLSSLIIVTLKMEAICSSEKSVLTRAAWCHIPEDKILHSHRRQNLRTYLQSMFLP
jgi:hypothetical protein